MNILQLLVSSHGLTELTQVEHGHERDQQHAGDRQRDRPHMKEQWVHLAAASGNYHWLEQGHIGSADAIFQATHANCSFKILSDQLPANWTMMNVQRCPPYT